MTPEPGPDTEEAFYTLVYEELKRIARHHLRVTNAKATLSTELVHEAYLKISPGPAAGWGWARSLLRRPRDAPGSRRLRTTPRCHQTRWRAAADLLGCDEGVLDLELDGILTLDAALEKLDALDPRLRKIVELRYFGGLTEAEIATMMGVTLRTIERNWLKARMFLLREMERAS